MARPSSIGKEFSKVFRNDEVHLGTVLVSACLPMLFQAVEIDGKAYWDCGYRGNPALQSFKEVSVD